MQLIDAILPQYIKLIDKYIAYNKGNIITRALWQFMPNEHTLAAMKLETAIKFLERLKNPCVVPNETAKAGNMLFIFESNKHPFASVTPSPGLFSSSSSTTSVNLVENDSNKLIVDSPMIIEQSEVIRGVEDAVCTEIRKIKIIRKICKKHARGSYDNLLDLISKNIRLVRVLQINIQQEADTYVSQNACTIRLGVFVAKYLCMLDFDINLMALKDKDMPLAKKSAFSLDSGCLTSDVSTILQIRDFLHQKLDSIFALGYVGESQFIKTIADIFDITEHLNKMPGAAKDLHEELDLIKSILVSDYTDKYPELAVKYTEDVAAFRFELAKRSVAWNLYGNENIVNIRSNLSNLSLNKL